jgi:hypothetical protein
MKRGLIMIVVLGLAVCAAYFIRGRVSYDAPQGIPQGETSSSQNTEADTVAKTPVTPEDTSRCIASLEQAIQKNNTKYEKGTVLVSFESGTTRATVEEVLADYDLKLNPSLPNNFSSQSWTVVPVGASQELSTVCRMKSDTRIKFVGVNPLLELHE